MALMDVLAVTARMVVVVVVVVAVVVVPSFSLAKMLVPLGLIVREDRSG